MLLGTLNPAHSLTHSLTLKLAGGRDNAMNDAKARLVGRLAVLGINPVRCRAERGRAQVTAEKNHCSCRVLQQSRDVQPDVLGLITSRDGGPTAASVTQ